MKPILTSILNGTRLGVLVAFFLILQGCGGGATPGASGTEGATGGEGVPATDASGTRGGTGTADVPSAGSSTPLAEGPVGGTPPASGGQVGDPAGGGSPPASGTGGATDAGGGSTGGSSPGAGSAGSGSTGGGSPGTGNAGSGSTGGANGADSGSSNAGSSPVVTDWAATTVDKRFTVIDAASDVTINPLRGYYRWRNQELVPQPAPARDAYNRYAWRDLEPSDGVFNFGALLADLQTARSQGRKFAFRVRMMLGYDDGKRYLPDYVVGNAACAAGCGWWADSSPATPGLTFVPDWNDAFLQQRANRLLQQLALALGNTEDIAWIDIGLFGQYGEWALSSTIDYAQAPVGIVPISDASKRAFVDMHLNAFPTRQLVMFALYRNFDAIRYATQQQTVSAKAVGLRIDCLGRAGFMDQWLNHPTEWAALQNQWQRAPFVTEFCVFGSGDPKNNAATALQQVRDFHISTVGNGNLSAWGSFTAFDQQILLQIGREAGYRFWPASSRVVLSGSGALGVTIDLRNEGNAPAYEPWDVWLELADESARVVWRQTLPSNLLASTGGGSAQSLGGNWQLATLAKGVYTLRLIARDARTTATPQRLPMRWNAREQEADGGVTLGTLTRN